MIYMQRKYANRRVVLYTEVAVGRENNVSLICIMYIF